LKKLRLAVLISGRGSNLQALIDACATPGFPAEIGVVVSNTPDAQGLARAASANVPAMIVDHTYFKGDKAAFEAALAAIIEQHSTDLICLAGFMRLLSADFLKKFKDKVINIHPSLLPRHKGMDTHAAALKAGDTVHGCSVHVVTAAMDDGPVIDFREVPVRKGDTAETLAARVLAEEHILYPDVVRKIATGDVTIRNGRIESKAAIRHHVEVIKESEIVAPMSHPSSTPVADPEAVKRAQDMWNAFTKASLIAGGAVALTLVLMAIFLV
jgi:phosphoribosylglycinamide formyltransferase-1